MTNAAAHKKLSGKEKAAIIMVAIGEDHAAKIYKNLKEEEIEMLTLAVATLRRLDPEKMAEVLNEFYEMCLAQKFVMEGGVDYAKGILQRAFGVQDAQAVIDKVISISSKSFDFMKRTDPKQLYNFIQNEHPQMIALILAYATKSQQTAILPMFSKEKQLLIVERIARMDRISPDVIKNVESMLQKRLSTIGISEATDEIGGIKAAAELMNTVNRETEKYIFDELAKKPDNLANEIRKLMFTFEDIVTLDDFAMSVLIKEIDGKDLRIALKSANEEIRAIFFRNMSKRNIEQIIDDMQYLKNIRHRDTETAQQHIVSKIRELEETGRIVVSHGRDDDIV